MNKEVLSLTTIKDLERQLRVAKMHADYAQRVGDLDIAQTYYCKAQELEEKIIAFETMLRDEMSDKFNLN